MTPEEELLQKQQEKLAGIEQQQYNLFKAPGNMRGETPNEFAAGKQADNSESGAVSEPVVSKQNPSQPVQKPAGVVPPPPTPSSTNEATAGMDYLNSLYTDPREEERLRKASQMNQRILAVGNALRHIGNIAATVNYAPSAQFNNPELEEKARYEKSKAIRDAANARYYTYQQQKAAQDAAQRKWEQQYELQAANYASQNAYRQEQARIAAQKAENQRKYQEGNLALGADKVKENQRYHDEQIKLGKQRVGIASRNASNMAAYRKWKMEHAGSNAGAAPLDTPKGRITPNAKNYSNQLLQMFDYAKSKGYVKESDVTKRLRELGFGKDQSDNVKRQMVMDLLRTKQDIGDYASSRLGWSYGGDLDLGLEDDDDDMDLGLE